MHRFHLRRYDTFTSFRAISREPTASRKIPNIPTACMQPFMSRKRARITKNSCKTKYDSSLHCQRCSSEMGHLEHILPELADISPRPIGKAARVVPIYTSWNSAFPVTRSLPSFPSSSGRHMFFTTPATSLQVSWGWSVPSLLVYVVGLIC